MGTIWRAYDRLTQRWVAFKQWEYALFAEDEEDADPNNQTAALTQWRDALAQEFRHLASLRHPHIVSVWDYGFQETTAYYTMELFPAAQSILTAGRAQPFQQQVVLFQQVLLALEYVRRHQVVHRDLKPGNILVINGQVKLLDFGLAIWEGQSHAMGGTLTYMAPETLQQQPTTHASDLFAAGVIFYELLAGQAPFQHHSVTKLIQQICTGEPDWQVLAAVPVPIVAVLARLLAKDPAARFATAGAALAALAAAQPEPTLTAETFATRESALRAAAFVGREAEMQELATALQAAQQGHGSAWLIGGASGVGKSRLLEELRVRALIQGAVVLSGQAAPTGATTYQVWEPILTHLALLTELDALTAGVLKAHVPQLSQVLERDLPPAPTLEASAAQIRFFSTVLTLLEQITAHQLVMIILEDLHWAAQPNHTLLRWVNRIVAHTHLLVCVTYRQDAATTLAPAFPEMQQRRLTGLSAAQVSTLSAAMLGLTATTPPQLTQFLYQQTAGNTFFVIEVMRALAEAAGSLDQIAQMALPEDVVPGDVLHTVQQRLQRIAPTDTAILELAAVFGRQLDINVLAHLLPQDNLEAWLSRCAEHALLEPRGVAWQFTHNQIQQVLLDQQSAAHRQHRHRQVAEALEALYSSSEYAPTLAHHWGAAGHTTKEMHYRVLAGEQALDHNAFREAKQYFERALELLAQIQPIDATQQQARQLYGLGQAQAKLGELLVARETLATSARLAQASADLLQAAQSLSLLGGLETHLGHLEKSEAILQASLALARRLPQAANIARTLQRLGYCMLIQNRPDAALNFARESLQLAQPAHDFTTAINASNTLGMIMKHQRQQPAALEFYQQGLELAQATGNRGAQSLLLGNIGIVLAQQGNFAKAEQLYTEAIAIAQHLGDQRALAGLWDNLGDLAYRRGDYAQSYQHFYQSAELASHLGAKHIGLLALAGLAAVLVQVNQTHRALPLLQLIKQADTVDNEILERVALVHQTLHPLYTSAALELALAQSQPPPLAEMLASLPPTLAALAS